MPKRVLSGTIVSDKGNKTVVVRVERRVKHPLYGKIIRLSKKYHAHDEGNAFKAGEQVRIQECAPVSKLKTWAVLDRIGAAPAETPELDENGTVKPVTPEAKAPKAPKAAAKKPVKATKATKAKPAKADPEPAEA